MLFPTTLVGSYPQPDWLIDREKLAGRFPPRVRARELWRIPEQWLHRRRHACLVILNSLLQGTVLPEELSDPSPTSSWHDRLTTRTAGTLVQGDTGYGYEPAVTLARVLVALGVTA
jgi:hypothetical protein